jgi:ATP-dependent Clp protease protease subunit
MIHQPLGGAQGQASDMEIQVREILSIRDKLNNIYVHHTGQALEVIKAAMDRDNFMSPEAAKEFGLIDEIMQQRPDLKETGKNS